jgi:hypothetical protein
MMVVCKGWGAWCNTEATGSHLTVLKGSAVALVLDTAALAIVVVAISVSTGLLVDSGRSARIASGRGSSEACVWVGIVLGDVACPFDGR